MVYPSIRGPAVKNRMENLTVDDLPGLRIPDGPIARDWLSMMERFLQWRQGEAAKKMDRQDKPATTRFGDKFFQWWFHTLRWRGKILDIGCGAGHAGSDLLTKPLVSHYIGVDPLLIENVTGEKWQFQRGVGEVMPFIPDGWANIVVAFSVLQHCINPDQLCKEVVRCMSRSKANRGRAQFFGTVCVRATPQRSDLVSIDFQGGGHVAQILVAAGLRIERQHTFEQGLYCFEAVLA